MKRTHISCGLAPLFLGAVLALGCSSKDSTQQQLPVAATSNGATESRAPSASSVAAAAASGDVQKVASLVAGDGTAQAAGQQSYHDWPKPDLVLVLTGRQNGYIEPCGCTGLANAKGGLARRHSLIRQLREKDWPIIALDVGNQVRRFGRQPEIKFQATTEGLRQMGYDAIGLGPHDLRLSIGELIASTTTADGESSFVCANAAVLDWSLTPRYRTITSGGKTVAVTAVISDQYQKLISSSEILRKPAAEGLAEVWPQMGAAGADYHVLLVQGDLGETYELARQFPQFDVVVTAGGPDEPHLEPEKIKGSPALIVEVGGKAMYAGVLAFFNEGPQKVRYQRVTMDAGFQDSPEMLALLGSYQDQLKQLGLSGLGLEPVAHPSGRTFVGSERCADCHSIAYEIWSNTPHGHATDSLVNPSERVTIPRHHDPECLSCHVTGWDPQQFFPYESGYLGLEQTPHLVSNGCENCHGPGSAHVAAETGEVTLSEDEIQRIREQMRLPLAQAEKTCVQCHDVDNSPDFHVRGAFEEYWKQIEHYED